MTSNGRFAASPFEMFLSLWRNRQLIQQLARREVVGRYRGSVLGLAWSFFSPLLLLVVYTFVFSVVFKARWGGTNPDDGRTAFAMLLFVGMIVHGLFAECVNRAPGLILSNANYVKKVVFPLETLPWVAMASAMFHAGISLVVLLAAQLLANGSIPPTAPLIPLILLPLVFFTMGVAWLLSSLGVFVRDIAQTTSVLTTLLLFMSPVFYPTSAVPEEFRGWLAINPLTPIIENSRAVLVQGAWPDTSMLAVEIIASLVVAAVGFWWFQRTRKGFADVI